jgi:preprotein translocase subunit YajC
LNTEKTKTTSMSDAVSKDDKVGAAGGIAGDDEEEEVTPTTSSRSHL